VLTPQQIHRIRDLIALGPLTAEEGDVELMEAGWITTYHPSLRGEPSSRATPEPLWKRFRDAFASERLKKRTLIIQAKEGAREKFYNADGGVRAEHWRDAGKTFAEYMVG
jgi:hypothetical protein